MALLQPAREFWLPKAGNRSDEYEDACRVVYPDRENASDGLIARAAVSDGASESAFAREWANVLTDAFVDRPLDLENIDEESLSEWLEISQDDWHEVVPWNRIPWHGEAKARAGAFATLVGLTISAVEDDDSDRVSWHAIAIGDSCLFVIRDGQLHRSFPLDTSEEFDNYPPLVSSNRAASDGIWEDVQSIGGESESGDVLILASDAIACWFLARIAAGEEPLEVLMAMDEATWSAWVEEQRNAGLMRNDDTTLLIIEIE